jgi:hypothetical protein
VCSGGGWKGNENASARYLLRRIVQISVREKEEKATQSREEKEPPEEEEKEKGNGL